MLLLQEPRKTLYQVIKTVVLSNPNRIYTYGLIHYKFLIHNAIHKVTRFGTNRIERKNLNLLTQFKRLNRSSICFSKSLIVLRAVLLIYLLILFNLKFTFQLKLSLFNSLQCLKASYSRNQLIQSFDIYKLKINNLFIFEINPVPQHFFKQQLYLNLYFFTYRIYNICYEIWTCWFIFLTTIPSLLM